MIRKVHKLLFKTVSFITLTYPSVFPLDALEYKKHFKRLRARIERKYGKARILWRIEFQQRGAPHFHLLWLDAPWVPKEWLASAWYECVGSGDAKHLDAGTQIRFVGRSEGNTGAVMAYVSKYLAKADKKPLERFEWTGRFWGGWNVREESPFEIEVGITGVISARAVAVGSRLYPSKWEPPNRYNWAVFGGNLGSDEFSKRFIEALQANF